MDDAWFRLVFLCTGNRARSAIAEALMRQFTVGLPVETTSAGVLDLESGPALPEALVACRDIGLDLSTHRSRPLRTVPLAGIDLVVGFERQHLASAVIEAGAAHDKAFLLLEILRLLPEQSAAGGDPVTNARHLVQQAHAERARQGLMRGSDEIADPFGKRSDVFAGLTTQLQQLVGALAERLFGVRVGP